jgi:hypothetical protein
MKDEIYITRFNRLKLLFLLGLSGGIIALFGLAILHTIKNNPFFIGLVLAVPFMFYSYYLALIHWKERYKGQNSKEWAIGFVLTASNIGFIILILYYINNIIPDMKALNKKNNENESVPANLDTAAAESK